MPRLTRALGGALRWLILVTLLAGHAAVLLPPQPVAAAYNPNPILIAPVNNVRLSGAVQPTFEWRYQDGDTSGLGSQELRITGASNNTYGGPDCTTTITAACTLRRTGLSKTTFSFTPGTVTLPAGANFRWRLLSFGPGGGGSAEGFFQMTDVPPAPGLLAPAAGATAQPRQPTLTWGHAPAAGSPTAADDFRLLLSPQLDGGNLPDPTVPGAIDTALAGTSYPLPAPLTHGTTYHWTVIARNASGATAAPTRAFTTLLAGPDLITPGGADPPTAPELTRTPTFSWGSIGSATGYEVQIDTDTNFTDIPTIAVAAPTTSYTPSENLPANALLFWRVRAVVGGDRGDWSAASQFQTPGGLAEPTLWSPVNQNTPLDTLTPTLDWRQLSGRADSYDLQVFVGHPIDDPGATLAYARSGLTGLSHVVEEALPAGATLYWRVRAVVATGAPQGFSDWPGAAYFSTRAAPPANFQRTGGSDTRPTFGWDAVPGQTTYNLVWSTSPTFANTTGSVFINLPSGATSLSYTLTEAQRLAIGTTYHVRVRGTTGQRTVWSPVLMLTPADPGAIKAPTLGQPAGASGTLFPTFEWSRVASAESYELLIHEGTNSYPWRSYQIAQTPASTAPSHVLANTSTQNNALTPGAAYTWTVRAINVNGAATTDPRASFTAPAGTPPVPVLTAPAGTVASPAGVGNQRPLLSWTDPSGRAASYNVRVQRGSNPTTGVCQNPVLSGGALTSSIMSTSPLLTSVALNQNLTRGYCYHWQVQAVNGAGVSAWSAPATLVVNLEASPDGLAVEAARAWQLRPLLTWNAVAGATAYRVQISTNGTEAGFAGGLVHEADSTTTSHEVSPATPLPGRELSATTAYFWRVRPLAYQQEGGFSAIASLGVLGAPGLPHAPTNLAPTTTVSNPPTFSWADPGRAALDRRAATTFDLRIGRQNNFNPAGNNFASDQVFSNENPSTLATITGTSWVYTGPPLTGGTYYFVVRGRNNNTGQTGPWSATAGFVVSVSPPPAPVLASPNCPAGQTGAFATPCLLDTNAPTFTWNASEGATTYLLRVGGPTGNGTGCNPNLFNQTVGNVTSVSPPISLTPRATVCWQVLAINSAATGGVASPFGFIKYVPVLAGPPTPVSPGAAESPVQSLLPTFTWQPVQYAQTYTLEIERDSGGAWVSTGAAIGVAAGAGNDTGTAQAYALAASRILSPDTGYRWRARATNEQGSTAFSGWLGFSTGNPTPPRGVVTISSPVEAAPDQPIQPRFVFSYDGTDSITSYEVQIFKCGTPSTTVCTNPFPNGQTSHRQTLATTATGDVALTLTNATLYENQLYAARVVPRNAQGAGAPSAVRTFRTAPKAPRLYAPKGATEQRLPTFEWAASGANTFTLQVSTQPFFSTSALVVDRSNITGGVTASQFSYLLKAEDVDPYNNFPAISTELPPGLYYWKVKATSGATFESFVESFRVTVAITTPPDAPTNLAVVNATTTARPTFTWSDPGANTNRAASYVTWQIRNNSGAIVASGTTEGSGGTSLQLAAPLTPAGSYTFEVVASNSAGDSDPSTLAFVVTVPPTSPSTPQLRSPATNVTGIVQGASGIAFQWRDPGLGTSAAASRFRFALRFSGGEHVVELEVGDPRLELVTVGSEQRYQFTLLASDFAVNPNIRYNWQVGARNPAIGYWRNSGLFYFTTAP